MMTMNCNFHFRLVPLQLLLMIAICVALTSGEQASLASDKDHNQIQQDESQAQQALTPEQWARKYRCNFAPANSSLVQTNSERKQLIDSHSWPKRFWYNLIHECLRDQSTWRARYIDELESDYKVLVKDSSLDERLANILLTLNTHMLRDTSYFQFNSGNPDVDRRNERLVAGPSVDDAQCELDLYEMVQQTDELAEHLRRLRLDLNVSQPLQERHLKLVRVLDSYGRYESGTLSANLRLPGAYRQCTKSLVERREPAQRSSKDMHMRYCWARTSLRKRLNPMVVQRKNEFYETGDDALPVGICLPKSCHSKNLNSGQKKRLVKKLLDTQLKFPATIYLDQHPDIDSIYCLPDADSVSMQIPTSGKLWIAFTTIWILICCVATYFNCGENLEPQLESVDGVEKIKEQQMNLILSMKQQPQSSSKVGPAPATAWTNIVKCFNLRSSWRDFTSDRVEPSAAAPVDLDVLNPVKVVACLFCIVSHSALMWATQTRELLDTAIQVERDNILQTALASSVVIDTFYVLSGLLMSFIACKRLARMAAKRRPRDACSLKYDSSVSSFDGSLASSSPKSSWSLGSIMEFLGAWFMLAANRYLRLVPVYAFLFYFRRNVFKYLGSGPFWDYGFNKDTMTGGCEQSSSLTPFNFESLKVPLNKQCIVTAWTVTNDILFALLIPPFLLLLQKRPKATLKLLCALLVACSLYSLQVFVEQPNTDRFEFLEIRIHGLLMVFNGLSGVYTSPIMRAASFLAGVIAGHALFNYSQKQPAERRWPAWLTGLATKLSIAYLLLHFILSAFQQDYRALFSPYHRIYAGYLMTVDRAVWSVANAVLFLRMTTEWRHGPLMSNFASQKWKSLARLNYTLLFIHWLIILLQENLGTSLPSYTHWNLFSSIATIIMASLPIALLVHVVFENPIDKLIKKQIFKL